MNINVFFNTVLVVAVVALMADQHQTKPFSPPQLNGFRKCQVLIFHEADVKRFQLFYSGENRFIICVVVTPPFV